MLHIRTLGGLSVFDGDRLVTGAAQQPRRLAILALLARAGTRGVSRDRLLLLLWPDADEERGRRGLNQALYALRQDLGGEDVILGAKELRLNPECIEADVQRFLEARSSGRPEEAAATWGGPFLDGFNLSGVPDFERWVDEERAALTHDYAEVLETLATAADGKGDAPTAVIWWRKLAAQDPLNGRVAESLIRSLVKAGDAPGALRHIEVHAALRHGELGLGPEPALVRLSERIRKGELAAPLRQSAQHPVVEVEPSAFSEPVMEGAGVAAAVVPREAQAPREAPRVPRARRQWWAMGAIAVVTLGALWIGAWPRRPAAAASGVSQVPLVAVGRIQDFTGEDSAAGAAPLSEMLATNLARASGMQVVSTSRLYEVLQELRSNGDSSAAALARAARMAGAQELVEGALYRTGPGRYRLDLRRIDLLKGSVLGAQAVEGKDLFALADSGTALLVERLGGAAPATGLASVTTKSEAAFRLYEAGIRAYYRTERAAAEQLFLDAFAQDSTFAMARYWSGLAAQDPRNRLPRMADAVRLADRASDRERLIIRASWAFDQSDPALRAIAESLVARYPAEIEGHLWLGNAALREGDFLAAVPSFQRIVELDSLGLMGQLSRCQACTAMNGMIHAYESVDSFAAAERLVRNWIRATPSDYSPRLALADVLLRVGRGREALAQLDTARRLGLASSTYFTANLTVRQFLEDWPAADSMLLAHIEDGNAAAQADRRLEYTINLRHQGRFEEALRQVAMARRLLGAEARSPQVWRNTLFYEGQVLFEAGRYREAAAAFEQAGRIVKEGERESAVARNRVWGLAHAAGAFAASGDTVRLAKIADSAARLGALSGLARDRRIASYPRALLLEARGDLGAAEGEYRRAMHSASMGYPRINLALARTLRAAGRPEDAVPVLQAGLHNALSGNGLYATRTEMHEALALAFEDLNQRDSAAVHWKVVAQSWEKADPVLKERYRRALQGFDR